MKALFSACLLKILTGSQKNRQFLCFFKEYTRPTEEIAMDQAKPGRNIVLWRKPIASEQASAWNRLAKAVQTLATLEEIETEGQVEMAEIQEALKAGKQVLLDIGVANTQGLSEQPLSNVVLVRKDTFLWNTPNARDALLPVLSQYPCMILEGLSATDMLRVLHLYLIPKNHMGVCPLMEKGSLIIGEKVQSLDSVGLLLDRFSAYFGQLDGFELKSRLEDFRFLVTALLSEAHQRAQQTQAPYPTVEFQSSARGRKLAIHFRFPVGKSDPNQLPSAVLSGTELRWHLLWQSCDLLVITHHKQHAEIEVHAMILSEGRDLGTFRSFLYRSLEHSAKAEGLSTVPKDYHFSLFSEIKVGKGSAAQNTIELNSDEIESDLDLGGLPEEVTEKIQKLEAERQVLKEFAEKKEHQAKEAATKLAETAKELNLKRVEISKLLKAQEHNKAAFQKKLAEYEKRIQASQTQAQAQSSQKASEATSAAGLQETIGKLEAGLRLADQEKNQLQEKVQQEQKRLAMYEQKYSLLFKDIAAKDKEIQELKASLLKMRKEHGIDENRPGGNASAQGAELTAKLKDFEQREQALKQELRKLQFKLDSQEKNLKAQQNEAGEKAKLMEQKLQTAKARELELLKKIEELTSALKKAAKAA